MQAKVRGGSSGGEVKLRGVGFVKEVGYKPTYGAIQICLLLLLLISYFITIQFSYDYSNHFFAV